MNLERQPSCCFDIRQLYIYPQVLEESLFYVKKNLGLICCSSAHVGQIFQMCLDCCLDFASNNPLQSFPAPEYEAEGASSLYSDSLEVRTGETRPLDAAGTSGPSESVESKQLDTTSSPRHCLRFLEDWTGQLRHFLSYFPDSRDDLIPLRELSQKIQDSIIACREALDRRQQHHFFLYR